MEQIARLFRFAIGNFGPLIVFYGANHFYGLRNAVITAVIFSVAEILYKLATKEPMTSFFKFSVLIALVFGCLDLFAKTPIFFRYEAAFTNVITGIYFGMTIWSSTSIIQEFVEKKTGKKVIDPNAILRLRMITIVWTVYFFIKAGIYVYLSAHYSIEEALVIRSTAGSASFYGLLALSIVFGKQVLVFFQQRGLLPTYSESQNPQ